MQRTLCMQSKETGMWLVYLAYVLMFRHMALKWLSLLTESYWRIYSSVNLVSIAFDNGLSPGRQQVIMVDLVLIGSLGTNFNWSH